MSTDRSSDAVAVGFIGLGNIGAPMAARLLDWPGGLTVFDLSPEALAPFEAGGARIATSPADVAAHATVISVMVNTDAQVRSVLAGDDGILSTARPGTVVAIHSTIDPETPAELQAIADPHGVHILDAPVSGGFMGAHDGTLAFLVGGSEEAVNLVQGPFGAMGELVTRFGDLGAGTQAKLVRNLITYASFAAAGEAMRIAEAAGLDLLALGNVVRHSDKITGGPGSVMVRRSTAPLPPDDFLHTPFLHGAQLGEKDLALVAALGDQLGVETPVATQAAGLLMAAMGIDQEAAR